jgi:PAS domain S-box-containing protein
VSPSLSPEARRLLESLSEQTLLRIVTENAHVGLVIFSPDRRYIYANTAYAEMQGFRGADLVGKRLADVISDVYEDQVRPRLDRAFAGERVAYESQRRIEGEDRFFNVRLEPATVEGAVTLVVAVLTDTTEQKRVERQRRFEQTMLLTEREVTLDAILVVDEHGKVVSYNGRFAQMWAIPADVLVTRVDAVLLQSVQERLRDPAGFMVRVQQLYDNPEEESNDEVELNDGRVLERYSAPMRDPNGRHYGRVWYFRDATERKQAEAALRQERDRAQRYLDTAEVILLALDAAGRITLINRKGCDVLGWSEATLLGTDWMTTCLPPEAQQEWTAQIDKLAAGNHSTVVCRVLTKDGAERLVEWRNTVLHDDAGHSIGTFSSGTDITDRRQLEEQYHQAQKMEAVGRLAGGVAHDFNNLLTLVLAYCQMLLTDLKPDDPMRADIQEIHDAGESAARLTRQLLSFSRKQIVQPKLLDLNELIRNTRGMLGRIIGEDVRIELALAHDLAPVTADSGQIEQILVNLAVNARDAMEHGGTLRITTENVEIEEGGSPRDREHRPGRYVSLMVTDTGSGMSQEVMAHLFEPFFTTKEPGKGTGLGLATVHGIVTAIGGRVSVSSELGKGSSFTIYLQQTEGQKAPVVRKTPVPFGIGETILIVEDAEGLRELSKRILERHGYRVLVASNSDEGRRLVEQFRDIRLIVTDVIMPGGSGPEFVRGLSTIRPDLRVIYMSGYNEESISHHGVLDPGIAFLQKPFTAESLSRKVREELDR